MSDRWFCWSLCDPDDVPGRTLREGQGFESLNAALLDLTSSIGEQKPDGYIASGNVALYWYRGVEEGQPA